MYNLPDVMDDISSSPLKDIWQPGDRQPLTNVNIVTVFGVHLFLQGHVTLRRAVKTTPPAQETLMAWSRANAGPKTSVQKMAMVCVAQTDRHTSTNVS